MILHVDMDAFYASVEEREDPALKGKPLIVGGTPDGRGVVAAANYAARKFGVHSAMPTSTALRRCPQASVLPPRIEFYAKISEQIREIFQRFTPLIEPLSLDEAFLDVTGSIHLFGSPVVIAKHIKATIQQELRLVASVGVAPNKYLAKLASDLEKPDGLVVVDPNRIQMFLDPLPIQRIWGVGKAMSKKFDDLGIHTIGQIRRLTVDSLERHFGKMGRHIFELAHGRDDRKVVPDRDAKSISHETTFSRDVKDIDVLESWLLSLTEQVGRRLRRCSLRARTVQVKVRYDDFSTITRSQSLDAPTDSTSQFWETARHQLLHRLPERPLRVRLLGVGVSNFGGPSLQQLQMFEAPATGNGLDKVTDEITKRFGSHAIQRALSRKRRTDDYTGADPDG